MGGNSEHGTRPEWDPDARPIEPLTPRQEFAAMVVRVTAQENALGLQVGYTPAIRAAENRHGETVRRFEAGELPREAVTAALAALEQLWLVQIAKAKRTRRAQP